MLCGWWPIQNSKYFALHNLLIRNYLNLFEIIYGEREVESMMVQRITKKILFNSKRFAKFTSKEDLKEKNLIIKIVMILFCWFQDEKQSFILKGVATFKKGKSKFKNWFIWKRF